MGSCSFSEFIASSSRKNRLITFFINNTGLSCIIFSPFKFVSRRTVLHETLYCFSVKCQRPFLLLMKFSFFSKMPLSENNSHENTIAGILFVSRIPAIFVFPPYKILRFSFFLALFCFRFFRNQAPNAKQKIKSCTQHHDPRKDEHWSYIQCHTAGNNGNGIQHQ